MHDLQSRIRGEYMEMPGMRLTLEQARRLCGVDRELCQEVLNALVVANFLRITSDGAYARCTDGTDYPRPRAAKAGLGTETLAQKVS